MKTTVALLGVLFASHAGAARAATLPVEIEPLSAAATACGISEAQLLAVASRALATSQTQPDADAGGRLSVRVSATQVRRGASCIARISVKMKAAAKPSTSPVDTKPRRRLGSPVMVFCNKGSDYSAAKDRFAAGVESATEYSIRQCLNSLKY